jgi:cobalt/nickel transport system permease protein
MHLPDGFLSPPVWASLDLVGAGALAACLARVRGQEDLAPRMGMLGAFTFAAQLVNVPVGVGTSGHLVGGVLLGALLGPEAATITMASVFVTQCLLFQDGGLLALGANLVNMGLSGTIGGWWVLRGLLRWLPRDAALFGAAWAAIVGSAALVAVELALSGTAPLGPALAAMVAVHALIGLLEGAISVAVVRFVARVRPELLDGTVLSAPG